MKTSEIIKDAILACSSAGLNSRVETLWAAEQSLAEPRYRVAFVGQFKTGKSTLINRVLLKEDLLFTDVLEATSIPTEIDYAEQPRLETYRYEKQTCSVQSEQHEMQYDFISGATLDCSLENPTKEQIRTATSGDTPEARAELASTFSHARLFWPAANLRQFTIVDTPGINTTNDAVVTTTYRILPKCDAIVFVTTPRTLTQVDMEFLRSRVFDSGITRCLVVLHYDSRFSDVTSEQLERIKFAIKAQLEGIGRGSIPISVAELAQAGRLPQGGLGRATVAKDPGEDLNDTKSATSPGGLQLESEQVLPVERDLMNFINENVRPGKEEKIRLRIRKIVELALGECQLELSLLQKSADERATLEKEIDRKQKETAALTKDIREDLCNDLRKLQKLHGTKVRQGLDKLEQQFVAELEKCESLNDLQVRVRQLKQSIQLETENFALSVAEEVSGELKALELTYSVRLREVANLWQDLDLALNIDGGLLEKTPDWFLTIVDSLLGVLVSSFPGFVDQILRFLMTVPGGHNLLPSGLVLTVVRTLLLKNANEQFVRIRKETDDRLVEGYDLADKKLSDQWAASLEEQSLTLSGAVARASRPADPARVQILQATVAACKRLLPELPVQRIVA